MTRWSAKDVAAFQAINVYALERVVEHEKIDNFLKRLEEFVAKKPGMISGSKIA